MNKETEALLLKCANVTRVADVEDEDGNLIPCFELGFLDTCEGWNLYAKCHREKNMAPYYEANEAYRNTAKEAVGGEKYVQIS